MSDTYNNRDIERAFGLERNTIQGKEDRAPELTALLKVVETFPWMIEVADYGYDVKLSQLYLQAIAINIEINKRKDVIELERNQTK